MKLYIIHEARITIRCYFKAIPVTCDLMAEWQDIGLPNKRSPNGILLII